jgi:ribosomal silencing factor RsfS
MKTGEGLSKQLSITITDETWDKTAKDISRLGCKHVSTYIEKALVYFLERQKHYEELKEARKEAISDFIESEDSEIWFSRMLDREFAKRAIPRDIVR